MADKSNSTAVPGDDPKSSSDYVQFKCLPPGGPLNRWSTTLTREHDFPGAQVWIHGSWNILLHVLEQKLAGDIRANTA